MKKKFSKILGIGLTLALVTSLLLMAAPVSADITQPTVSLSGDEEISETNVDYTMVFRINKELLADDTITVKFPDDTDVAGATVSETDPWGVTFTSGIGYDSGEATGVTVTPNTDDLTVEIELDVISSGGIGDMAYVQVIVGGITNPTDTGTYTLEVKTNEEDVYVESESYDIGVPVVGGFVYVYNPSNILLATFGGKSALNDCEAHAANYFDGDDYTIMVGPGTYAVTSTLDINGAGLTLESSEGAADTIIDASTLAVNVAAIKVDAAEVTVDGFTIEADGGNGIWCMADDAIIQNNVFTFDSAGTAIDVGTPATGVTVSGNELSENAYMILHGSDCTVSDNTFGDIINFWSEALIEGATITDNIFLANEDANFGILLRGYSNSDIIDDTLIEGNTFDSRVKGGILIGSPGVKVTDLTIRGNDIINSEADGIRIYVDTDWSTGNVIKFNTITGNEDYGINNEMTATTVDATFNWWGTTVSDDIADMVSGDVTYDPFLTDIAGAAIVDGKAATNTSSLDAKTECGVKVSGMEDDNAVHVADVISAFEYAANPQEAIDDAIGFYDVYVALETGIVLDEVDATLKFYDTAITAGSTVLFWTGDFWALCSDQDARAGLVWVTVTEDTSPTLDELGETPFVVVAGEAVAVIDAPVIAAPASGATGVSLTPTFAWTAVADADGYYFEFADNANFVVPLAKLDGDLGRLIVTAYAHAGELPYSTAYYWRVKAVSGTVAAGDLAESIWASGVFITMAEPEEPTPPVVIEDVPPPVITQPDITIEIPEIVVPLPAETPITPAWIYVIIGVGAVLVIGLIVLIVRTRRIA